MARLTRQMTEAANRTMEQLERRLLWIRGPCELEHPLILILGAPRSGSTLVYQSIVQRYDVGYFSNLHDLFYRAPALVERISQVTQRQTMSDFRSQQGNTRGWLSPSENWRYWYRFFRRSPQYVPGREADPEKLQELCKSIRAFGSACGRPVVVKNLPCALRLEPLQQVFPNALFIVTHRDWHAVGRSILAARMKTHGTYQQWWSVEPPGFEELQTRPPYEQVVEQIRGVYAVIDSMRERYGANRFLDIEYEAFCTDVASKFARLQRFLDSHNIALRNRGEIPEHFHVSNGPELEPSLERQLVVYCEHIRREMRSPQVAPNPIHQEHLP